MGSVRTIIPGVSMRGRRLSPPTAPGQGISLHRWQKRREALSPEGRRKFWEGFNELVTA